MEKDEQFQALGQKLKDETKSIEWKTETECEAKKEEIQETKRHL